MIWSKEHSIGYLPQEPQLDDSKTVKEVVQEGVQEVMDLLKEYEEVNMKFAEPMSDEEMDKLMTRQNADNGLQQNITQEAQNRQNADTVLQNNIDNEKETRIAR